MASERVQHRIERLLDQIEAEADQENWQRVCALAEQILDFASDNSDAAAFLASGERALARTSERGATGTTTPRTDPPASSGIEVSAPEQPTSFANGRYQVKRFLGEGGKKKVYLATDTLLDRDVAFALIKIEGLDEPSRDYNPSIMASDRIQRNIERLLDEVDNAIARRDWISVRDHAQDVLALAPTNSEASAFLAAATRALSS